MTSEEMTTRGNGSGEVTAEALQDDDDDDNTELYIIIAFSIFGFLLILGTAIIAACTCRKTEPSKRAAHSAEQDERYDVIEHDYNEQGLANGDGTLKSTEPSVVGLTDPVYAANFESTVLAKNEDAHNRHDITVEIENDQTSPR